MDYEMLILAAMDARTRAYAPYSNYTVGAALLDQGGNLWQGCNVENAAYGVSNCAERTAFFKAVSEGVTKFAAIAVVGGKEEDSESFAFPCGVCRQVMMEFCDPAVFEIIVATSPAYYKVCKLEELLPMGFGPSHLNG